MNASQCAVTCTNVSQCPGASGAACDQLTGGVSACVTNPNGSPDAGPLPGGACANVGGPFGDSVENGGYRCTPTANGDIGTGINQCQNGTWIPAYSCTCMVTSSINGQPYPSDCTDINAPGSASCSYALDSCEQCAPGTGCQSM